MKFHSVMTLLITKGKAFRRERENWDNFSIEQNVMDVIQNLNMFLLWL